MIDIKELIEIIESIKDYAHYKLNPDVYGEEFYLTEIEEKCDNFLKEYYKEGE